jgi:multimeric flavodoxin WrbA
MKKVLVINGSPRKDSVSTALCDSLSKAAGEAEIKTYNAYKLNAKPCIGCGMFAESHEGRTGQLLV